MNRWTDPGGDFSILALDGGGCRGIYIAQILARVEQALGAPIRDCFDLIAGTSTGSIVAGAAAAEIPMDTIVGLFEHESSRIFRKPRFAARFSLLLHMLFRSRYSRRALEKVLADYVPHLTLGEMHTPLMITSADISTGRVHVFKSAYLKDLGMPYTRDGDVLLSDAVLASCAAPMYFDPKAVEPYLLVDGGLWANNPSIIALTEAMSTFKKPIEQVRVLSIGSGHTSNMYSRGRLWGLLTGWGAVKLVSYAMSLQSQASTNMAKLILKDRYLRLDPETDTWELDDTRHLGNLKALADRDFTHESKAILDHIKRATP